MEICNWHRAVYEQVRADRKSMKGYCPLMKVSAAYGKFQRQEQRAVFSMENRGRRLAARPLSSPLSPAIHSGRKVQLSQEILEMRQKWKSGPPDQKCSHPGWLIGVTTKTKHTLCQDPIATVGLSSRVTSSCCEQPPATGHLPAAGQSLQSSQCLCDSLHQEASD